LLSGEEFDCGSELKGQLVFPTKFQEVGQWMSMVKFHLLPLISSFNNFFVNSKSFGEFQNLAITKSYRLTSNRRVNNLENTK
jgi:hypothetical protein